jgi:hypothetical protein
MDQKVKAEFTSSSSSFDIPRSRRAPLQRGQNIKQQQQQQQAPHVLPQRESRLVFIERRRRELQRQINDLEAQLDEYADCFDHMLFGFTQGAQEEYWPTQTSQEYDAIFQRIQEDKDHRPDMIKMLAPIKITTQDEKTGHVTTYYKAALGPSSVPEQDVGACFFKDLLDNNFQLTEKMTPQEFRQHLTKCIYPVNFQLYFSNSQYNNGLTIFHHAVFYGNLALVKEILYLCGNDWNRQLLVNLRVYDSLTQTAFNTVLPDGRNACTMDRQTYLAMQKLLRPFVL